jgi:uncharacterized membrane protein
METVARLVANQQRGATLVAQVNIIAEQAERKLASDYNFERVRAKALAVLATIESTASVEPGFVPCEVPRATYSGG